MATVAAQKPHREDLKDGEVLCDHCTAKCCRYFALPIETPEEPQDYQFIRWYLIHGSATVFVEDEDWYLMVHNVCDHLQSNNMCGIYETRPQICRDYSTDNCEYEDDWTYDRYFEMGDQMAEYVEAITPKKKGKSIRSKRPEMLPVVV